MSVHVLRFVLTSMLCASLLLFVRIYLLTSSSPSHDNNRKVVRASCYPSFSDLNHVWIRREENLLQSLGRNGSYIYSAYLDDRQAPDVKNGSLPVIRVLGWVKVHEPVVAEWRCLLWFHGLSGPVETSVIRRTHFNAKEAHVVKHKLASIMIVCRSVRLLSPSAYDTTDNTTYDTTYDTTDNTTEPFAVSVVTEHCLNVTNVVPVINLIERREMQQIGQTTNISKKLNFTVCVHCPVYGTRYSVNDLVAFIETNRVFGAQRFVFYVEFADQNIVDCLRRYERLGVVQIQKWPFKAENIATLVFNHGHTVAMNDCLYRTMYLTTYIASQDLDEFIVPTTADNWQSMINNINANLTKPELAASYSFKHRYFPTDLPDDTAYLSTADSAVNKYKLKTSLKIRAAGTLQPWSVRSKVIYRPERLLMCHTHLIHEISLVRRGDVNVLVNSTDGTLDHYRQNVYSLFMNATISLPRMRSFEERIVERLKHAERTLRQIKLAPSQD